MRWLHAGADLPLAMKSFAAAARVLAIGVLSGVALSLSFGRRWPACSSA